MLNTLEQVNAIFLEQAPDVDVSESRTRRLQELGLDSLTFVDILVKVEKVFDIEVTDEELGTVHSVQDILDLIERKA